MQDNFKIKINDEKLFSIKIENVLFFKKIEKIKSKEFINLELNETIKNLILKMVKTCLSDDGIGLAAPQIGVFKKVFIIRDMDENNVFHDSFTGYFNPEYSPIIEDGKEEAMEGCLSVPGKNYIISRWKSINATWIEFSKNEPIKKNEILTGYRARIFQHEFDHINGISIVDRDLHKKKK